MEPASPLLVVTGPPGAGKSTVAALVATNVPDSALVLGDAFFAFLPSDAIPPWEPAAHEQNTTVIRAAGAAAGRFAQDGFRTIYDGVVGAWFLPTFLEATTLDTLDYCVLLPSVTTCIARVRDRHGHGFRDADTTAAIHRQFTDMTVEGRHVLRDVSGTPDAVADRVAAAWSRGDLRYTDEVGDTPPDG